MILFDSPGPAPGTTSHEPPRRVFRMEKHDRMGGSVPVWDYEQTAKESVAGRIAAAGTSPGGGYGSALAYRAEGGYPNGMPREFGFRDVLDIVNPLHHVPVVGTVYRAVTGDQIQPSSRIVGGAIFGGGAGAASGIVNLIAEEETGRDLQGNVIALARGESVELKQRTTLAYNTTTSWQGRYNR